MARTETFLPICFLIAETVMASLCVAVNSSIVIVLVALSWLLPRKFGAIGLFAAQLSAVAGWFSMGYIALVMGIWPEYEDGLVILGLALQAFLFNCLMLPLGIWAVCRWRRLSPMSGDWKQPVGVDDEDR